jgi:hypothetical protein
MRHRVGNVLKDQDYCESIGASPRNSVECALYVNTGQRQQARTELSTAIELYRDMDMIFWLPQAEVALAQVEGE